MVNQAEVRESHEQFSAAWSLYARCSGAGEVVDLDGLRVANARQPWFLMNAALLTEPVRSQTHLAARAHESLAHQLDRRTRLLDLLGPEPQTAYLLASQIWADSKPNSWEQFSGHLRRHHHEPRVLVDD